MSACRARGSIRGWTARRGRGWTARRGRGWTTRRGRGWTTRRGRGWTGRAWGLSATSLGLFSLSTAAHLEGHSEASGTRSNR